MDCLSLLPKRTCRSTSSSDEAFSLDDVGEILDNIAEQLLNNSNGKTEQISLDDNDYAEAPTVVYGIQEQTADIARANRKARILNTRLLNAIENKDQEELESCLRDGASPNATCFLDQISACHAAAYGNTEALDLLLKRNADRNSKDAYGRTPLHVAAWAGNDLAIKMLLTHPTETHKGEIEEPHSTNVIKSASIDVPCELVRDPAGKPMPTLANLPKSCLDSLEHKCKSYLALVPKFNTDWTPLHVSSYAANHSTTKLLVDTGANPNSIDTLGQTPLDVAGAATYLETYEVDLASYVKTIKTLTKSHGKCNKELSLPFNCYSALHTAVELCSIEAIEELLAAGAPVTHHNARGNTPLHECVMKGYEKPLKILVNHSEADQPERTVDVKNVSGHTALHMAIRHSWIPGVCITLDAGADVTTKANDSTTAVHIAALEGNLTILKEVLENVRDKSAISDEDKDLEAPLLCAMRSGNLDCVRLMVRAGAPLSIKFCKSAATYSSFVYQCDTIKSKCNNLLLHAATDIGHVNILKYLLDQNEALEKVLQFKSIFFYEKTPVEYAIRCIKDKKQRDFGMLKFLLKRTPGIENFDPPVAASILDSQVDSVDTDIIKELLEVVPSALKKRQTELLHKAIEGLHEEMTRKLIEHGADLSGVKKVTATSKLIRYHPNATEFISSIYDSRIYSNDLPIDHKYNKITIDYGVLVPAEKETQEPLRRMKVLTALLDTGKGRGQRRLLSHLLVETYIHWNWSAFSRFLYMLISVYSLFVTSLSIYVVSVFYYKDVDQPAATLWSPFFWQYPLYLTLLITMLLELSCVNITTANRKSFKFWIKLCMKFGTYILTCAIPPVITIESTDTEWRRHVASLALVLALMNLMVLMSSTPLVGIFIQIFWKVTAKVLKILFSFSLLIFMFSFIFMVQFHTSEPFDGPIAAIFKTLVMMTSEFDYEDNFKNEKGAFVTIELFRLIFIIFLLLVAIVIMNLVTGVAVTDVQILIDDGTIRRLEMQVYLMKDLELSMENNEIFKFLRLHKLFQDEKSPKKIEIFPSFDVVLFTPILQTGTPSKAEPIRNHEVEPFMDAILDKAREQFDRASQKAVSIEKESQMKEIHKVVTSRNEKTLRFKSKWEKPLQIIAKRNRNMQNKIVTDNVNSDVSINLVDNE